METEVTSLLSSTRGFVEFLQMKILDKLRLGEPDAHVLMRTPR